MKRTMLKSKIHRATVTEANLEYEGSVSIDTDLLAAADIVPYEAVDIWNCTNGARLRTYAIPGVYASRDPRNENWRGMKLSIARMAARRGNAL